MAPKKLMAEEYPSRSVSPGRGSSQDTLHSNIVFQPLGYDVSEVMTLLLKDVLPRLADELVQLLVGAGEHRLAEQVPELRIVDRCRCGDDFCATFYTQSKPHGSHGAGHENVVLEPEHGMLILDVVAGSISCVEY
jgi:hypothetical protein